MDASTKFEILLALISLVILQTLRFVQPLDVSSKLDPKRHAKTFLPITFTNRKITALTLFLPPVIVILTQTLMRDSRGMIHAATYISRWCLTGIICQIVKLLASSPRPNAVHLEDENVNKMYDNSNFESRQSFFSGHSAAGIMASLFLRKFFQTRLSRNLVDHPLLQVFFFIFPVIGLYPGYTQWRQHWHHLHDVFVGYLYGFTCFITLFADSYNWVWCCHVTRRLKTRPQESNETLVNLAVTSKQ